MKKVLIVDDDVVVIRFLKELVSHQFKFPSVIAKNFKEAKALLEADADQFCVALIDLVLPDAKDGECADLVLDKGIPCIVMTGSSSKELQAKYLQKAILDYVNKESNTSFDYTMRLIQFIYGHRNAHILLVDDVQTTRMQMRFALEKLPILIHEAGDGKEALAVLKDNPQIKLVITDRNMPQMNGMELIQEIRKHYGMNELAIIGISASDEPLMCVEFLKNGANDFVNKPFVPEEIFSRVISSLEMQHYVKLAQDSAVKDYLTGLHNRKYLYETGRKLYENAKREHLSMVVGMIDIDYFKKINDRYGHEAGDLALKVLGDVLGKALRQSDVVARYGGEEFCVILTNTTLRYAQDVMDKIRLEVEETVISLNTISFRMTLSVGIVEQMGGSFDEMLALADKKLYQAKEQGRNRVLS